jgi:hypothetical protein
MILRRFADQESSTQAFFRDLQFFGNNPNTVPLLHIGNRQTYRECTRQFLASCFIRPWVRTSLPRRAGSRQNGPNDYRKDVENLHCFYHLMPDETSHALHLEEGATDLLAKTLTKTFEPSN